MISLQKFKIDIDGEKYVVVVNYKIEKNTGKKEYDSIHHIHIADRSGSMSWEINNLIDNIQHAINHSDENDLNTIGWFSGPGEFRVPLKAAKKFDEMGEVLNSLRSTISTTCFSDILKEIDIVLKELNYINKPVNITLFTDGNPVVPWSINEEKRRIFMEIEEMKKILGNNLVSFNTIGYGNYYDKNLLTDIADMTQYGTFFHSTNINQYLEYFRLNHEKIKENIFEPITISGKDDIIYLNRKFTKLTTKNMKLDTLDKEKNQFFIIMDKENEFIFNNELINVNNIKTLARETTINNFMYAYAYNMYYNGKYKNSLNMLSILKDKKLIDSHFSSFTYDERNEHIQWLKSAVFNTSSRFVAGQISTNYIPTRDALCVMDIIKELKKIDAIWVPFHKDLEEYKRIGVKIEDTYDMFVQNNEEIRGDFTDIIFNKETLNMSLRVEIPGYITINPKQAQKVNLPSKFECIKYRNYTLIKDGNLNMKKIMCLVPIDKENILNKFLNPQFPLLSTNNKIEIIENKEYVRMIIDLIKYPIINQMYVDESVDIENIFDINEKILNYECVQKIINYYLKGMADKTYLKKEGVYKKLNKDQIELLQEYGISKECVYGGIGGEKKLTGDSYIVRIIKFYFAGISDLPPMEDMFERINTGKKLTTSMEILHENHNIFCNLADDKKIDLKMKNKEVKMWLQDELKHVKGRLNILRDKIAIIKMALVLTGNWFENLSVDNKNNYYYEKNEMKMICKTDYKEIKI